MAVRIRLKKLGRKHRPFFRVCAMESRNPRDGRVIEELGTYDPMIRETDARAVLNGERIDYWLSVGAKPTPKVGVLIRKYGTDGTHLDKQQAALDRLASRRADSIVEATKAAEKAAQAAPKPKTEEESAPAEETSEAASAESESTDESTEQSTEDASQAEGSKADTASESGDSDPQVKSESESG